ncbi:DNA-protecting protein DprA, partial [Aeromonas veronii]|nr:DNA-protecting protein DprA [Aeromonas veronii]
MSKNQLTIFLKDLHSLSIQSMLKQYNDNNVGIITIFDQEYPRLLKQIYDPPWVIYTLGDKSLLNSKKLLSVVGSRTPSSTSLQSMTKVLEPLIKQNWVLVSGLARGIDTMGHQLAIRNNGK